MRGARHRLTVAEQVGLKAMSLHHRRIRRNLFGDLP
jgi:hypothetical protein